MKDQSIVEDFKKTWKYTRGMTSQFIDCVPEDKWSFSHHSNFAPLSKQFIHMARVYSCYIDALETKVMDLSKKKETFNGDYDKNQIQSELQMLDKRLWKLLDELYVEDLSSIRIDFFGDEMSFNEFSHIMIQHECAHFGIWKNYATFGEFETPKQWQNEWDL